MESKNTFVLHETEAFMRGELDNVTIVEGRIVLDLKGQERQGLTVEDLLERFKAGAGKVLDNDRILLSND